VVIVGGTGLNFTALTGGLAEIPAVPAAIRAEADGRMAALGRETLLADLDPATRARIDPMNGARVQRAWEVWRATGRGLADWQAETPAPLLPRDRAEAIVLTPDTAWLNDRIDRRFEGMIAAGALDEARANLSGWDPARPSSRAIGGPELVAHLQGRIDLVTAIASATLASRQYAKRQRTWFRSNMADWTRLSLP
jgi:tRNA dimethylallyltransferase